MAKIDTALIEGYADMSAEEKLKALEGYEYDDHAAELDAQKRAVTKANSEAAEWKRKHNALLTEEDRRKQEQEEKLSGMEQELQELREGKRISEFQSQFLAQGYEESLALETAQAMVKGDTATVFANQKKFLDEYAKKVRADAIKGTPKPKGGGPAAQDWTKQIDEARARGDFTAVAYYTRLQAQAEVKKE